MRSISTLTGWFASALLLATMVAVAAGCSFESTQLGDVRCENEGVTEGTRRCENGFWVDTRTELDGGGDADVPDTCVRPSDTALCLDAQVGCGTFTTVDSCGGEREVDCGGCAGEAYEQEVGAPYPCCESGQTCQCQDVEQFEPRCQDGVCEVVSLGIVQRTTGCAPCNAECGEYGECDFDSTCALTGTRSRSCEGQACVDGACVESDEPFEQTEVCPRATQGDSCAAVDACSVGSCEAGECASTPICDGTLTSCGCDECEDCSSLDDWYNSGPATNCCDEGGSPASCTCQPRERREYSCDGNGCVYEVVESDVLRTGCSSCSASGCSAYSACDTGSVCGTTGTQVRSCDVAVCRPATGLCGMDTNVETQACTVVTDGDRCPFEPFPGCNLGACAGGSCGSGSECQNTDVSCGCESCVNCSALDDEWIVDEDSFQDCCEGDSLCECGVEVRHEWVCGEAACELSPTRDTRTATRGCDACSHSCIESAPGPCCSPGGSGNCQ